MTSAGQPKQSSATGGGDPFIHALDEVSDAAETQTPRVFGSLGLWLGRRAFDVHLLHCVEGLVTSSRKLMTRCAPNEAL